MVVRDVVEEEASLPPEERTVDGAGSATLERPLALAVVRKALVGVVELVRKADVRVRVGERMKGRQRT